MSRRTELIRAREPAWRELERALDRGARTGSDWAQLSEGYRAVCADLARARSWGAGEEVVRYLESLAGRAHGVLYGARPRASVNLLRLVLADAPREIRASGWLFWAAFFLFYGPLVLGTVTALIEPTLAERVVPIEQLDMMLDMYSSGEIGREAGEDFTMTGFYVLNNVGIALRCFATGALAGLGPVFYLVYNGLVLGTVQGYVIAMGAGSNFLTFVSGHSSWELTAVVVSGAAGLRLGLAIVLGGGAAGVGSRLDAVRHEGPALLRMVAGAAFMLFIAALIEGLWSASLVPAPVKWGFGLVQWGVVGAWLWLGGRRS